LRRFWRQPLKAASYRLISSYQLLASAFLSASELSIFDSTTLGDLSAEGRLALLSERGAATGNKQFVYLRKTDGSPPMRPRTDGQVRFLRRNLLKCVA